MIKIGEVHTPGRDPHTRVKELSRPLGIANLHELTNAWIVEDSRTQERKIHALFGKERKGKSEYFTISPVNAAKQINLMFPHMYECEIGHYLDDREGSKEGRIVFDVISKLSIKNDILYNEHHWDIIMPNSRNALTKLTISSWKYWLQLQLNKEAMRLNGKVSDASC